MERGESGDDRQGGHLGTENLAGRHGAGVHDAGGPGEDLAWGSPMDGGAQFVLDTYWSVLVEEWKSPQTALVGGVALSVVEAQAVVELLRGQAAVMHDLPGFPDRGAAMVESLADHIASRLSGPPVGVVHS